MQFEEREGDIFVQCASMDLPTASALKRLWRRYLQLPLQVGWGSRIVPHYLKLNAEQISSEVRLSFLHMLMASALPLLPRIHLAVWCPQTSHAPLLLVAKRLRQGVKINNMATAYHLEALRRQRVVDRAVEARDRMAEKARQVRSRSRVHATNIPVSWKW